MAKAKKKQENNLLQMKVDQATKNQLVQNALISRSALINQLLEDKRDLDCEAHYPREISKNQYQLMYDREGIGARVVRIEPQESWAVDPSIIENEDVEETNFEKAWIQLQKDKNLFAYLERADELSGIGHFGVILLGIADGKRLEEEAVLDLGEGEGKEGEASRDLMFVRTFPETAITIDSYERDETNPRFGQPQFYNIQFRVDTAAEAGSNESLPGNETARKVHWTRVVHLADNRQSSEVFGTPRMKDVFNRLLDLRKVLGGSGEMFWKGAFPGYSFEVDPSQTDAGAELDADSIRDEFERYSNSLQRYIALTGVTAKSLAPQVSDPNPHMVAALKAVAISKGIPWRILLGSEEAKLASTQDKDTWRERVKYRQHKYLTPWVLKPFIDRLIALNILPKPSGEAGYEIVWPDLAKQTDKEKAEVGARSTEALSKYVAAGVEDFIPPFEFLTIVMGYSVKEADAIVKAAGKFIGDTTDEDGVDDDNGNNEDE